MGSVAGARLDPAQREDSDVERRIAYLDARAALVRETGVAGAAAVESLVVDGIEPRLVRKALTLKGLWALAQHFAIGAPMEGSHALYTRRESADAAD